MSDELLERLRAADPATGERIAAGARSMVDLTARIVAGEGPVDVRIRRLPRLPRRAVAIGLAAALLVAGVAIPLALLSPLGGPEITYGPLGDGWFRAGSLQELRSSDVTFLPQVRVFVVAPAREQPYALSAISPHLGTETLAYCRTAGWFFELEHGAMFDLRGNYELGPAARGMSGVTLRVEGGWVDVNPGRVTPGPARGAPGTDAKPDGPLCGVTGELKQVAPGIFDAAPPPSPAPIEVTAPLAGAAVTSPVRIAGTADVFEAVVSIRILDQNGDVLAGATTMASCGTGCRGDYSTRVRFAVDVEQPGMIQVFEVSAKDGSMVNVVEVPVTLVP
ncbi:MAG: Gmad2 immunoglobulin-like domain-containing protein [Actinobacteria bacterium]|nr:Gmad2 immunoglobulin-like domain-containing protein [Actinomycetota bacterium]